VLTAYLSQRGAFRAKATLAGAISTLRCFGEFLMRKSVWRANPLRWMRGPRIDHRGRLPRRIGTKQMEDLWEAAAQRGSPLRRKSWVAMLGVLYGTGVRRGELVCLDVEDWSRDEGLLYVDGRKTDSERRVAVPELVWRAIEAYLPERHNHLEKLGRTDEQALFVNMNGERAKGATLHRSLKRLGAGCGIDVTFHQFRHTCATDLLESGTGLREVQELLGHASLTTTMWYNHVANPALRKAVALHPINTMLGRKAES
jgi:site-specific recombinase XerD